MKNLWNEFKEFAFKGNVIDMAVGVILGGALKDVVTALVNMFMGVVSAIIKIPDTAKDRFKKEEAVEEAAPAKSDEVVLLEEIRDLLKKNA